MAAIENVKYNTELDRQELITDLKALIALKQETEKLRQLLIKEKINKLRGY
jgi:hypothetical protein